MPTFAIEGQVCSVEHDGEGAARVFDFEGENSGRADDDKVDVAAVGFLYVGDDEVFVGELGEDFLDFEFAVIAGEVMVAAVVEVFCQDNCSCGEWGSQLDWECLNDYHAQYADPHRVEDVFYAGFEEGGHGWRS